VVARSLLRCLVVKLVSFLSFSVPLHKCAPEPWRAPAVNNSGRVSIRFIVFPYSLFYGFGGGCWDGIYDHQRALPLPLNVQAGLPDRRSGQHMMSNWDRWTLSAPCTVSLKALLRSTSSK
jgi:hypothetical protein